MLRRYQITSADIELNPLLPIGKFPQYCQRLQINCCDNFLNIFINHFEEKRETFPKNVQSNYYEMKKNFLFPSKKDTFEEKISIILNNH